MLGTVTVADKKKFPFKWSLAFYTMHSCEVAFPFPQAFCITANRLGILQMAFRKRFNWVLGVP